MIIVNSNNNNNNGYCATTIPPPWENALDAVDSGGNSEKRQVPHEWSGSKHRHYGSVRSGGSISNAT